VGRDKLIDGLNQALQNELGNVIRYLHHSFLVRGVNRGPLVEFFREKAQESFQHATNLGEKIVALGGLPTIQIPKMKEIGHKNVEEMLREELTSEKEEVQNYIQLLRQVGDDIALEFMLKEIIKEEQEGIEDLEKRLR
jgi:bacterioferritin